MRRQPINLTDRTRSSPTPAGVGAVDIVGMGYGSRARLYGAPPSNPSGNTEFSNSRGRGGSIDYSSSRDVPQQFASTGRGGRGGAGLDMSFGSDQTAPAGHGGRGGLDISYGRDQTAPAGRGGRGGLDTSYGRDQTAPAGRGGHNMSFDQQSALRDVRQQVSFDMSSSGQPTSFAGRGRGGPLNISSGQHVGIGTNGRGRGGGNNFGLSSGLDVPSTPQSTQVGRGGRGGGTLGMSSGLLAVSSAPVSMDIQKNESKQSSQIPVETKANHQECQESQQTNAELVGFMRNMSNMCAELAMRLERKNGN